MSKRARMMSVVLIIIVMDVALVLATLVGTVVCRRDVIVVAEVF